MNRNALWGAIILGTVLLGGLGVGAYRMTRGLRNNNPGNIRRSADAWQGLAPVQTDPDYFQFVRPEDGLRALARVLLNYEQRYGLNTVRKIVSRWAPHSENPTEAYIHAVARRLDVGPDDPINVDMRLPGLVTAITYQENGIQPYTSATIAEAVRAARAVQS